METKRNKLRNRTVRDGPYEGKQCRRCGATTKTGRGSCLFCAGKSSGCNFFSSLGPAFHILQKWLVTAPMKEDQIVPGGEQTHSGP